MGPSSSVNLLNPNMRRSFKANPSEYKVTYAIFAASASNPWVQREIIRANQIAVKHKAKLLFSNESSVDQLVLDMKKAREHGAEGAIVFSPDCRAGDQIVNAATENHLKLIAIDNDLRDAHNTLKEGDEILLDYGQASTLAGQAMVKAGRKRKWEMDRTGAILFTSGRFSESKEVTERLTAELVKAGLQKDKIFTVPAEDGTISTARENAADELRKHVMVRNWFVGGYSDEVAIGGIRAIEDVHIGPARTIGVGIDGDGAIYDLQRPNISGLIASVLLPAGKVGETSSEEMYEWIASKTHPHPHAKFPGILLDRDNVRALKRTEHLIE